MRSLWAAGLLLRRLRTERAIVVLTLVLVAATSIVFSAAPRLLNRVADDSLRAALQAAAPAQRDVALSLHGSIAPGAAKGVSGVHDAGDQLAAQLPPTLAGALAPPLARVTTVRFELVNPPIYDTRISLRYQDGMRDATRLVAGRWPADLGMPLLPVPPHAGGGPQGSPAVFEIALSSSAAEQLGLRIGDRLPIALDGSDPLIAAGPYSFGNRYSIGPAELQVVGLYEPLDPDAEIWAGDAGLLEPTFSGIDPNLIAYATAYVSPEMYPNLISSDLPFRYEWRFVLDPSRLDAGQVGQLRADLRGLGVGLPDSQFSTSGTVLVQTGLPPILDRFSAELATATAALSIATIGPLGLAGGAMAMLALLLVRRRAAAMTLARGRGASGALVIGTELWEGIVLAGGASLLGLRVAVAIVPARASPLTPALAVAVGATAVLLLVLASWNATLRPPADPTRDDAPVLRVSPRRLVIELTIVGIAVAATLLLRQRGVTIGPNGALAQSDPLLASVPILSGLAAGIVAARLYPLPVRALGWLAAQRRDVVPVLGLRTVGRQAAAANVPLLVLMLTAAFGAFSAVVVSTLDRGQVAASYLSIGADYRLEAIGNRPLPPSLDPTTIPGVSAVAPGIIDRSAPFAVTGRPLTHIYLAAIDPRAYETVIAGSAAEPSWPAAFLAAPPTSGLGTADHPIPVILSTNLPTGSPDLAPGATFQLTVVGRAMTFRLAEERTSFPGIDARLPFALVPFDWVQAAIGRPVLPSAEWLRATREVGAQLASRSDVTGAVRIVSRYTTYDALHDRPLNAAIGTGYTLAVILAAGYMVLTIVGAMVLSAARRTRDLAFLRTLGVSARQALGLTLIEHATPVVLALVPGVALGIGVAVLCQQGLGLDTFVGMPGLPLVVDWVVLAWLSAAFIGLVAAAVAASTWLAQRAHVTDALRFEER